MKKTTILPILGFLLVAAVLLTAFSVKNAPQNDGDVSFKAFLKQFPAKQLPYALDETKLVAGLNKALESTQNYSSRQMLEGSNMLKHKYYKFLPNLSGESSFSRLPITVEPIALLTTANHYAVVYSINRSFSSGFRTYNIAVLDKKGKQISCNVAANVLPQNIVSCTISTALMAELKTWKPAWALDYEENGSRGNSVKDISLVESQWLDLMVPTPDFEHPMFKREKHSPLAPINPPLVDDGAKTK